MTSSGYNHRFFDIESTTRNIIAALLDKYEYCATTYGIRAFYWSSNCIYWQEGVTRRELNKAVSFLHDDLAVLEILSRKDAKRINGKAIKQQNGQPDNANYYLFNFDLLADDAIVSKLLPLYDERIWKDNQHPQPDEIGKFDEGCRNAREQFKLYIQYLADLIPTQTEQETTAEDATEGAAAADNIDGQDIDNFIESAIRYAYLNAREFRRKHNDIKFYTDDALQWKAFGEIWKDICNLAKIHGIKPICRFVTVAIYSHLTSSKAQKPVVIALSQQIEKISREGAADKLAKASRDYNILLKSEFVPWPDTINPLAKKREETPPTQEQTTPEPVAPVEPPTPKRERTQEQANTEQPQPVAPVAPIFRGDGQVDTQQPRMPTFKKCQK